MSCSIYDDIERIRGVWTWTCECWTICQLWFKPQFTDLLTETWNLHVRKSITLFLYHPVDSYLVREISRYTRNVYSVLDFSGTRKRHLSLNVYTHACQIDWRNRLQSFDAEAFSIWHDSTLLPSSGCFYVDTRYAYSLVCSGMIGFCLSYF